MAFIFYIRDLLSKQDFLIFIEYVAMDGKLIYQGSGQSSITSSYR